MAKLLYLFISLLVLAVVAVAAFHRFENPKSKYDDFQAVIEDDAIGRGWIPDFLPKSATEIVEQHPIDESHGYVSFNASVTDIEQLRESCSAINYDEVKYFSSYPIWWPDKLTGSNSVSVELNFYLCEKYGVLTSLDGNRMFYWWVE